MTSPAEAEDVRGASWLNNSGRSCGIPAMLSISVYALSGPVIIMVNKTIIKENHLDAPALVSTMGILFSGVASHIAGRLGWVKITPLTGKSAIPPILAVGLCTAFSFLLGNKAYNYLDASFLQMMKAATPALLMIALVVFRIEKITCGVSSCCLVMVAGSILAVLHSPHVNTTGVVIQLGSQCCEVMQQIMLQFFLQQLKFNAVDAGYYIAPSAAVAGLCLACLERDAIFKDNGKLLMSQVPLLVASGLTGICVNFSSYFVIQFISSLMAKLIVVARSAALVFFLVVVWHEDSTSFEIVGYAVTLVAFFAYSVLKTQESKNKVDDLEADQKDRNGKAGQYSEDKDSGSSDQPLIDGDSAS